MLRSERLRAYGTQYKEEKNQIIILFLVILFVSFLYNIRNKNKYYKMHYMFISSVKNFLLYFSLVGILFYRIPIIFLQGG